MPSAPRAAAAQPEILPVHTAVKGRARIKVAGLRRNIELRALIETHLPGPGIRQVRASCTTGSLIVLYDAQTPLAAVLRRLRTVLGEGARPQAERPLPWHAMPARAALARLDARAHGLSSREAARRRRRWGPNRIADLPGRSRWEMLSDQFGNLPTALLAASAGLSLLTGALLDAAVILSVVALNSAIGFFAEAYADRTIRSLSDTGIMAARVIRGGRERTMPAERLVPGEIIALRPGDLVPADARLLETDHLTVNEASLTGESLPAAKEAHARLPGRVPIGDRRNLVFRGTVVTGGSGRAAVTECGPQTEIGRVQALVGGASPPATPLQRQLDDLGRRLTLGSAAACVLMFAIGWLRGFGLVPMLKAAISLGVAAIPEGLPTMATTALALAIEKLRREKVLVRRLGAVEGLAAINILCFDKTGTLTLNRMVVNRLAAAASEAARRGDGFDHDIAADPDLRTGLELAALCNDAEPGAAGEAIEGSSTEAALLLAAAEAGIDVPALRRRRPRLAETLRAEGRRYMTTAHDAGADGILVALKGDPGEVLRLCRQVLRQGRPAPLDEPGRERIRAQNAAMAEDGLRVLGIAYRIVGRDEMPDPDAEPGDDFVWAGLAGMADPLRPGMAELIARFHRAGIRTAMITGDQPATAAAIARELRLGESSIRVLKNGEPIRLEDGAGAVFARVAPAQKLDVIRALQRSGYAVAMIGDGVNDTPALKAADIGITLGHAGTEAARQIADIVLMDDDLNGIALAVEHGRTVYVNLRKGVRFLLATNFSEILLMLFATAFGAGQPLSPVQLLWINLLSDVLPALGLALEPPEPGLMRRPPSDPAAPLVRSRDYGPLARDAALMAGGAFLAENWSGAAAGRSPGTGFASLAASQLFYALTCRSDAFLWDRLPVNWPLIGTLGLAFSAQGAALFAPGLRRLLGAPRRPRDLAVALGSAALPILLIEGLKLGRPRR